MRKILLTTTVWLAAFTAIAQSIWTPSNESSLSRNAFEERIRPAEFKVFNLNERLLEVYLNRAPLESNVRTASSTIIIEFPNAEGKMEEYKIVEAPVMEPELSAKYPGIKSYTGQHVRGRGTIRFNVTPLGFHAVIMYPSRPTAYIDPIDLKTATYMVVSRTALPATLPFDCKTVAAVDKKKHLTNNSIAKNADDGQLRQFGIAIAAAGSYSQRWLDGSEANDNARITKVIAALNTNLVRVNAIMERDFGARFNLIGNNNLIVYLDAAADPFTTSDLWNSQAQATIDGAIGTGAYDIGHLVIEEGDFGNAGGIGTICNAGSKGSGYTSRGNWNSGIVFEEYILTHEMGHQCDANHTFSHDEEGGSIAQVEPGSGTTIMSYAGITGANTDIISLMDDYFHAISIQQATNYIEATACGSAGANGNATPTANAGSDYTIPKSTPFILTGIGTDADGGNVLSYGWEQMDVSPVFPLIPNTTRTSGPQFRSYPHNSNTSRTFPVLANILDGTNNNKWEVLSEVDRTLNFRFTVRDNNAGAGANKSDDMVLTIEDGAGPFKVTSPNSAVTWCPGEQTVTWDVASTDAAPINVSNVNILLSTDGGITFATLVANTPNDGSQLVNIGCTYNTTARIKVEAVGNIFFDISNTNFTIGDNTPPTFTVPANIILYKDAACNYDASVSITEDVTDEADNCDNSLNATFVDNVVAGSCEGETVITRTWTLTDDCLNSTVKNQVILILDNIAPTFTVPADITIYKDENCDHDASPGATGDVTDEADNCDPTLDATFTDVVAPGVCIGSEIITRTWKLMDDCGNETTAEQVITVLDTIAPIIANISATPNVLWPVNHKMVQITVSYDATDNCSDVSNSLSVSSNQPINGLGDGNTSADWQVINDHTVLLRAERSGKIKSDRIYTITITSTDNCGNESTAPVYITVPHSKSGLRTAPNNIFEVVSSLKVQAVPNPSRSNFVLYINGETNVPVTINIKDGLGRVVEIKRGMFANSVIAVDQLKYSGVYFVEVIQGKNRQVIKLVKQ